MVSSQHFWFAVIALLAVVPCFGEESKGGGLIFEPSSGMPNNGRKLLQDKCITFINRCILTSFNIAIAYPVSGSQYVSKGWEVVSPGESSRICYTASASDTVWVYLDTSTDNVGCRLGAADTIPIITLGTADFCIDGRFRFDIIGTVNSAGLYTSFFDRVESIGPTTTCGALSSCHFLTTFYEIPDTNTFELSTC